jgi:hypothetical protein
MTHAELPRDLGWSDILLEQVHGAHAAFLHRCEVASLPNMVFGHPRFRLLYRNGRHTALSHG